MKLVCKDFWYFFFRQQASRLQANKKGIFVIHDVSFPPLQTLSKCSTVAPSQISFSKPLGPLSHPNLISAGPASKAGDGSPSSVKSANANAKQESTSLAVRRALSQIQLSAGIIEGFLAAIGFSCNIEAGIGERIPACAFQVTIKEPQSSVLDPARFLSGISAPETAAI